MPVVAGLEAVSSCSLLRVHCVLCVASDNFAAACENVAIESDRRYDRHVKFQIDQPIGGSRTVASAIGVTIRVGVNRASRSRFGRVVGLLRRLRCPAHRTAVDLYSQNFERVTLGPIVSYSRHAAGAGSLDGHATGGHGRGQQRMPPAVMADPNKASPNSKVGLSSTNPGGMRPPAIRDGVASLAGLAKLPSPTMTLTTISEIPMRSVRSIPS